MDNLFITHLSEYTSPLIIETKQKDYVMYGEDNLYFDYLIEMYLNSTTNNSIINGICAMIYGRGLNALDSSRKPDEYAQAMSLFSPQCLQKFIKDRYILGMSAFQLAYRDGKIVKVEHFPMQNLRAQKCNEDGEIEAWYYSPDWSTVKTNDKLTKLDNFGFGNQKNGIELIVLKPYQTGSYYYSAPSYIGALPYCKLESEIADYLINDCLNSFSGTKIVNFNNGVSTPEKMQQIKNDVVNKLTGSRGEKVIVSFNDNSEARTEVTDVPLNDAPEHYRYLADECFKKLVVGHRVTSPMLLGIREGNDGLGNNADEIKNATLLFQNIVIKGLQEEIIEIIDTILAFNNISLDLYFRPTLPLSFMDEIIDQEDIDDDTKEEETGVEMTELEDQKPFLDVELGESILDNLQGETIDENEWEIVDEREAHEDNVSEQEWADASIEEVKMSKFEKIRNIILDQEGKNEIWSDPNGFSYLDSKNGLYKIRYKYVKGSRKRNKSGTSREFCVNMMRLSDDGVVYRIEDIDRASRDGVNRVLGHRPKGASEPMKYDLFKFKGGKNCFHIFVQILYRKKKFTKVSKDLKNYRVTKEIPKSYKRNPWGTAESVIAQIDRADRGAYPK